jgi:hypothetical protein
MRDQKHAERRLAEMLGGVGLAVGSRSQKATPAVEYRSLSVEVEICHRFPGWLSAALRRVEVAAADEQDVPVAVLYAIQGAYPLRECACGYAA